MAAALLEYDRLPHPDLVPEPVEAFVVLFELQAMGQQLVDRQPAGAKAA
jgi:hypothetical protein